ncbi:hypothetical protein JKF63_02170 [Porcisia hertigi]|uniref:Fungal lipase-type domain-containing protein n=1 Tax=Porcisia hertigi TaxID=2761500 RepID=A0A836H7J8_9TRYP|nr:hypothetical protein JKF63_02170 [Porcisia hertigi]
MKRLLIVIATVAAALLATIAHADKQVTPYLTEVASRSLKYSRVSYCSQQTVAKWSCGPACDAVPGYQTREFFFSQKRDAFGYAGVDTTNQQIVVAFRGTNGAMNWWYNLLYTRIPYTTVRSCGAKCSVHFGFYAMYLSVRPKVMRLVLGLLAQYPGYEVLVTGHSLGGALAVLAAVDLQGHSLGGALAVLAAVDLQDQLNGMSQSTKPVALYTFGAPRVGDKHFAAWTAKILAKGPHYRITHARDPVPHLPPKGFGFLHAPTEVFFRTSESSSMLICDDSSTAESRRCSNKLLSWVVDDHLKYLNENTGCPEETSPKKRSTESAPPMPKHLYARLMWEYLKNGIGA